jgi:hypothetical protein
VQAYEAYPLYDLGRLKSLDTLKMEAISSSETSVITRATRYIFREDISDTATNTSQKVAFLYPTGYSSM